MELNEYVSKLNYSIAPVGHRYYRSFAVYTLAITEFIFHLPYVYTLNTIYACWAIGALIILPLYGLLLYMNGWRSMLKTCGQV